MKELGKRTGLKTSQVYKWHWDQKQKEKMDQKEKLAHYPSEIFQVTDAKSGKNITAPLNNIFKINKN
jgi:hypothetical protein